MAGRRRPLPPPPGGYGSAEYRKIVPSGNLPALVDDGLLIADSEAIAEYLNEKHPTPPMLPQDLPARAKIRERSRFHDTRLEPAVRALFPLIPPAEPDRQLAVTQASAISDRLRGLAEILPDDEPAQGAVLTLGDCGLPITFAWIEALTPILDLDIEWPSRISEYRARVARHPAVAAELAEYVPCLSAWLKSREA